MNEASAEKTANVFSLRNFRLVFFGALVSELGATLSFINIPISTTLMRIVDKDKLSKVTSILSILTQGLRAGRRGAAGLRQQRSAPGLLRGLHRRPVLLVNKRAEEI